MADISDFVRQSNAGTSRMSGSFSDPRDAVFAQDEIRRKKQQQPAPQAGGIMGFLQNAGKSIGSDFSRVGQGTANVFNELTGGAQRERDVQNKSDQQDVQMIKNYGDRIKNAKTPEEKQRYKDALSGLMSSSDKQSQDFIGHQNEIVEQNDPIKGAAAVAGIGTDVLGGGAGSSILKGGLRQAIFRGLKQGAVSGAVQGALDPLKEKGGAATAEDIGGNALTGLASGAAFGGLTGGVLKGGSKILGNRNKIVSTVTGEAMKSGQSGKPSALLQKFGNKAEKLGNNLMGSQANLTRAEARKLGTNPSDVMGSINKRTGLSSMDDMAEVGRNLTGGGEDSLLDTITRSAIGESKGVDVGDLRKVAQEAIDNGGSVLSDSQRKNLLRNMTQAGSTMRGGAKGSLDVAADPGKALDQANIFRSTARDLTKGLNVSAEQRQQAKIYNDVAHQIEQSLYNAPGVNESLPLLKKAGVDDMLFKAQDAEAAGNKAQAQAYKQLATELGNVQDIGSLRKMKKDFVDLSKVDDASARAQAGAGAQLGDNMQGLGRLVQKPTNLLAIPLNAATPKVGSALAKASRVFKGNKINQDGLDLAFNPPSPVTKALQGTAGATFGSLINPTVGRGSAEVEPTASAPPTEDVQSLDTIGTPVTDQGAPADSGNIFTKENIQNLILQDMAGNQGKNVTQLLALYKAFGQEADQKVNATTQKALAQSANGEATISQLESLLSGAGGGQGNIGGNLSNFLGGLGVNNEAKTYNDLSRGSVAQIAKALGETGTLSDSDISTYSAMIPKLTDTSEVAQNKIAALRERLQTAQQNTARYGGGSSIDLTDLLGGKV